MDPRFDARSRRNFAAGPHRHGRALPRHRRAPGPVSEVSSLVASGASRVESSARRSTWVLKGALYVRQVVRKPGYAQKPWVYSLRSVITWLPSHLPDVPDRPFKCPWLGLAPSKRGFLPTAAFRFSTWFGGIKHMAPSKAPWCRRRLEYQGSLNLPFPGPNGNQCIVSVCVCVFFGGKSMSQ